MNLVATDSHQPRWKGVELLRMRRAASKSPRIGVVLLLAAGLAAAPQFKLPFGSWKRLSHQPIIFPQGNGFESAGTFNPAVVEKDGNIVMFYRAQDRKGTSTLGYATSKDGVHFQRSQRSVFGPEAPYEKGGGTEDPRIVRINQTYYMTYTGYNNVNGIGKDKRDAQLCLATSTDLVHWKRWGVILPAYKGKWNVGWTKSGAIVPEKINGQYWMYYLGDASDSGGKMGLAVSRDLLHWTDALDHPVLSTRPGLFDAKVVEPGPPPVITPEGIFLIYNGADDKLVYSTGWALFDRADPTRLLARADMPIFRPVEKWEKTGQVPNVVFVEGLIRRGSQWLFYYGGADRYIGVAEAESQ
ncbi:MAG TPA: glycoside hydrolase family 130 protein [Terriglobia bacterium]|nr:glycoside hydrolase family 130 protein [Terriglobia bacterium]